MIVGNLHSRTIALGFVLFSLFQFQGSVSLAEEEPAPNPATQAYIEAIKRRAQEILEERRDTRLKVNFEDTVSVAYEKNPSNLPEHKGDWSIEEDLSIDASKKLTPTITWRGTYYGSFLNYFKLTDDTYTVQSLRPARFVWKPNQTWQLDAAVDLGDVWYPNSSPANYRELKPWIGVRQNLWGDWFHSAQYLWSVRHYISARASDGTGTETLTPREDSRHTAQYDIGTIWKDTYLKIRNEYYINKSNDAFHDFYDAHDYRVSALISRPLTERLSVTASYSYELKHYNHRPVTNVTPDRARHDEIETWTLSGTYDFNKTWSLTPTFTYTHDNSNDPTGEYFDWTISTGLTARF